MSHELELRFNSPTVNLWFKPDEFIRFLKRLKYYLFECEMQSDANRSLECGYPVGRLDDIHVYFMHYDSFEQAKRKWNERQQRVNMDNLYIVMVERDGCTEKDLAAFDKLDYKHKVVFTAKEYPQFHSAYHIPGSEEDTDSVKDLCLYQNKFTGKRWLDEFDWVSFLNERSLS